MLSRSGIIKAAASLLSKPSSQTMTSAFGSSIARKSSSKNSFVNRNQNSLINGRWQRYYVTGRSCIKNLILTNYNKISGRFIALFTIHIYYSTIINIYSRNIMNISTYSKPVKQTQPIYPTILQDD